MALHPHVCFMLGARPPTSLGRNSRYARCNSPWQHKCKECGMQCTRLRHGTRFRAYPGRSPWVLSTLVPSIRPGTWQCMHMHVNPMLGVGSPTYPGRYSRSARYMVTEMCQEMWHRMHPGTSSWERVPRIPWKKSRAAEYRYTEP